jgi:hypothetical protein
LELLLIILAASPDASSKNDSFPNFFQYGSGRANHSSEVSGSLYLKGTAVVIEATAGLTLKGRQQLRHD